MEIEVIENTNSNIQGDITDCDNFTNIIEELADNKLVLCKSQQRDESDITKNEKIKILREIFEKNKSKFLSRFGQFLNSEQAQLFEQFRDDPKDGYEVMFHIRNISRTHTKKMKNTNLRNRRYAALKRLVEENSYFSETEMMKRNPLLYEQLVGRYLSTKEKRIRDRRVKSPITFVGVLMDGIEREHTEAKRKKQEEAEDAVAEEEEEENSDSDESEIEATSPFSHKPENKPIRTLWGEIHSDTSTSTKSTTKDYDLTITAQERKLLKEEFVSSMYENFLEGKDDDFDYNTVDNNDEYDNLQILEKDEEEKYFDSEEPEDVQMADGTDKMREESSEDELDIYMNALNQHPVVCQLSEDMKKL